jgi:hypothetical protein
VTGCPFNIISPSVGLSKPASIFSRVDLPHPEGPTKQTNWPSSMERHIFSIALKETISFPCTALKLFVIFLTSSLVNLHYSHKGGC